MGAEGTLVVAKGRREIWQIRPQAIASGIQHGYVWLWLVIFALPFVTTTLHSLRGPQGGYTLAAYSEVFGSFRGYLLTSIKATLLTIIANLLLALPAAYGIVRHEIPGKRLILSTLNLALYTP